METSKGSHEDYCVSLKKLHWFCKFGTYLGGIWYG